MTPLNPDKIILGDCLEELKSFEADSIDFICTDPPYGIGFMGKEWDTFNPEKLAKRREVSKRKDPAKKLSSSESRDISSPAMDAARYDHSPQGQRRFREWWFDVSVELLRVLKPGAFTAVCIGARQDSVAAAVTAMTEAGFKTDFTSLFWTYASGFPKAGNIGKMVDKRLGVEPTITGDKPWTTSDKRGGQYANGGDGRERIQPKFTRATSDQAKALDGSYAGFQPKPAVEVIIVAMKPLSEKTFVDQALKNVKGISWLDDARIPTGQKLERPSNGFQDKSWREAEGRTDITTELRQSGKDGARFPANLLVSDNALSDHSRFFNLDKWAQTLPFLIVPKASKGEKNEGLEGREPKAQSPLNKMGGEANTMLTGSGNPRATKYINNHPTIKPLKLMSYLITLFSREGDTVLDPFCGSGTTCLAAKKLRRQYIGIEREAEYVEIAQARLNADKQEQLL